MHKLNFLGRGSAFNTKEGNNSAYFIEGNTLYLLDCGELIFSQIQKLNIKERFKDLDNFVIMITHTHPDHVGSLGSLIFYLYHIIGITPIIVMPSIDKNLKTMLKMNGVVNNIYEAIDPLVVSNSKLDKIYLKSYPTEHTNLLNSYGYEFVLDGETYYYTGDCSKPSNEVVEKVSSGEYNYLFVDTSIEGLGVHCEINYLNTIIPEDKKANVYCMHIDCDEVITKAVELGFNVVENIQL